MFSLFGSTYICEQTFSVMNFNKNKQRSSLTDGHLEDILKYQVQASYLIMACLLLTKDVTFLIKFYF